MSNEQVFIAELKKHMENPEHKIAACTVEAFQGFVAETVDSFLDSLINKDMVEVEQMLKKQRKIRKLITGELRKCPDQAVIISSKYVQTYNLMNKMLQNERRKKNTAATMKLIEKSYAHTRKVLIYLYRHANVQHKTLVKVMDIPKSTLSDLLRVLETAGCVEKIGQGKYSFFNLTVEGRKYVREAITDIDQEVIVDQRSFRSDVLRLVENKTDFNNINSFAWRSYKKNTVAIMEVNENGIQESSKWKSYECFPSEYLAGQGDVNGDFV